MAEQAEFDRRRFLKQAATVAWATPLILSVTPSAHAQVSCAPMGTPCGEIIDGLCFPTGPPCCGACVDVGNGQFCVCQGGD